MSILAPANPTRLRMITEAVWTTLYLAYKDPDDRSNIPIRIPIEESVTALLTCAAKLIAMQPNATARQRLIAAAGPALDRAVTNNRAQAAVNEQMDRKLILPQGINVTLPN